MSQAGWFQLNSGVSSTLNIIFFPASATGNFGYVAGDNGVILKTTNAGSNWVSVSPNTTVNFKTIYFLDISNGWAAGRVGDYIYVYHTSNAGNNWTLQYYDFDNKNAPTCSFFRNSNKGYIGGGGINLVPTLGQTGFDMKTTNGGQNWVKASNYGRVFSVYFPTMDTGWKSIFWLAGSYPLGNLQWTTNGGVNWDEVQVWNLTYFYDINFCGAWNGWAVGYNFELTPITIVYRTHSRGYYWNYTIISSTAIMYSIYFINDYKGWMCGQGGIIRASNDTGKTWTNQNSGVTADLKSIKFTDINTGYAVGNNGVILKTTTGGSVGINNQSEVIKDFSLEQNYPNPFNPTTKIRYSVPLRKGGEGVVTLKVYDILGKEIATLVNAQLQPGTYEVTFDGNNLSGGIYFYQLRVGNFVETKKMVMLK
jgi:photosystem II stability/assembly factor-like uncharacterized protein